MHQADINVKNIGFNSETKHQTCGGQKQKNSANRGVFDKKTKITKNKSRKIELLQDYFATNLNLLNKSKSKSKKANRKLLTTRTKTGKMKLNTLIYRELQQAFFLNLKQE